MKSYLKIFITTSNKNKKLVIKKGNNKKRN